MADASIWDTLGGIAQSVGQGILSAKANKQAQKMLNTQYAIAKLQSRSAMPTLGMGYAATPLGGGGGGGGAVPVNYNVPVVQPSSPLGQIFGGGMSLVGTSRGRITNPRTQMPDTALLWSSDLAAVRRVGKVARKLGRFVHKRRPR